MICHLIVKGRRWGSAPFWSVSSACLTREQNFSPRITRGELRCTTGKGVPCIPQECRPDVLFYRNKTSDSRNDGFLYSRSAKRTTLPSSARVWLLLFESSMKRRSIFAIPAVCNPAVMYCRSLYNTIFRLSTHIARTPYLLNWKKK